MAAQLSPSSFQAVPVTDKVYWVGAIDWSVRNFHGYLTSRGTTYNAYLVMDEKITLVDTVKAPFQAELMARVASVVDPTKIDYLISNHSEMDHSGCIPEVIEAVKPEKVFASKMGAKALADHFHIDREITVPAEGETLSLGELDVNFVETRMLHWPDSMFSYVPQLELLFSQDAFGMHLASYKRFADELDANELDYEAAKYYANIILHLSGFVTKALAAWQELGLPLGMVCPDHGPIWRRPEDIERIIGCYARWAQQAKANKAVVVYDTMWRSTDTMARAVGEGLAAEGAEVKLLPLDVNHRSDVATELLDAGAMVVGSPTLNNNIFPTVADALTYLKGLRPKNLVGGVFGSFGWSGEAPKQLAEILRGMDVELVNDPLRVKYVPRAEAVDECYQLGRQVAQKLQDQVAQPA